MMNPNPICDFCSQTPVVWRYPARTFALDVTAVGKDPNDTRSWLWECIGDWGACEICATLVEAEEWDTLAARSLLTSPVLVAMADAMVEGEIKKAILELHKEFQKARTGVRVPV